jgi:hypothetical protein
VVIPKGLRVYFGGRREVWKSLCTTDKAEAECRSLQWQAQGKRLFHTLQRHGDRMTKHQIDALISRWLEDALDEAEDERAMRGRISEAQREDSQLGLSELFDGAREALAGGDYRTVTREADELLRAAGLPALDHTSADFTRLCRRLLRAKIEYAQTEAARWDGMYREDHLRASSDALNGRGRSTEEEKPETAPSPPFSEVMEKYLASSPRPPRTAEPMKAEFLRFIGTLGGDRPIASITRADVVRYKESLQARSRPGDGKKQGLLTMIKHLSGLDALFKWAEVHAYTPTPSPVKGLVPSKRQAKKQALKRQPFTDEELLMVLGSPEFLRQRKERPERYWLVLLLLFQICRREEAGQLYIKDIQDSPEGIAYINITDTEKDQTLKNEGSRRKIPLHSALAKLGFLHYLAVVNALAKKDGIADNKIRVFPQLTKKGNNGYADPVGKWFGRLVTGLGLTNPALVLHSLRHGGITKLHDAAVPVNLVETLTGHSAGNVHEQYVHKDRISMKTLSEALEKLQYAEVLNKLRPP